MLTPLRLTKTNLRGSVAVSLSLGPRVSQQRPLPFVQRLVSSHAVVRRWEEEAVDAAGERWRVEEIPHVVKDAFCALSVQGFRFLPF